MRKPRLIMTDIDGTLIPEGRTDLNPEYFDVIRELTRRGVVFVVASGRHAVSIRRVFEPVMDLVWVVSQNGAVLSHGKDAEALEPIPKEWVHDFWQDISRCADAGAEGIAYTPDRAVCPFFDTEMYRILDGSYRYELEVTGGWDTLPDANYSMVTLYHPSDAETLCREHFEEKWGSRLNLFVSGDFWVDCVMPGISKGSALTRLCERLDIDPADTIAFGDNLNDIPMLQAAGTGYAVDNARPEVQAAADGIVPGYREDGVLRLLKQYAGME